MFSCCLQAFINYDFSYTEICARKTVLREDVHVTNNKMIWW